jgi:hypothetical protein
MQEVDRVADAAVRELREAPAKYRAGDEIMPCAHAANHPGCAWCDANPMCCARPMNPMPNGTLWCDTCGTSRIVELASDATVLTGEAAARYRASQESAALPHDAVVLVGIEAERYRAMVAAARAAQDATKVVQATGIALRDAFQALCAWVTKDGGDAR